MVRPVTTRDVQCQGNEVVTAIDGSRGAIMLEQQWTAINQITITCSQLVEDADGKVSFTANRSHALTSTPDGSTLAGTASVNACPGRHGADRGDTIAQEARDYEQALFGTLAGSLTPLTAASQYVPYALGSRDIARAWPGTDRSRMAALYDAPPESTIDWLLDDGQNQSNVEPFECKRLATPSGFTLQVTDALGVPGLLALQAAAGSAKDYALASLLRTDALELYASDGATDAAQADVAVAWRMRFATADDAQTVAKTLAPLHLEIVRQDRDLLLSTSSQPDMKLFAFDRCAAPL